MKKQKGSTRIKTIPKKVRFFVNQNDAERRDYGTGIMTRSPEVLQSRSQKETTMQKTSPEISELKKRIEGNLKRKIRTPNDFIFLVGAVWERTHQTISPTTLKRLWGYIDGADETRDSTLHILSNFLGFDNWDAFVEEISQGSGSDPVTSFHIKADDLRPNDRVFVSWKPDRRCTFRYLGNQQFIVEQAENSKLKVGNTFYASLFILGEPLYLSDLVQGNNLPLAFVVGNKDGLCELEKR